MEQLQIYEEFISEEAITGTAAIDRIKEQYFDGIVLDTSLPDMCDGKSVGSCAERA